MSEQRTKEQWWCPECQKYVPGEHVTYFETHDERAAGCGHKVLPDKPAEAVSSNLVDELRDEADDYSNVSRSGLLISQGAAAITADVLRRGADEIERLTAERDTARRCLELTQEQQRGASETKPVTREVADAVECEMRVTIASDTDEKVSECFRQIDTALDAITERNPDVVLTVHCITGSAVTPVETSRDECVHNLIASVSTLRVIDPHKAQCRVCYEFFDLPLQSPENGFDEHAK